MQVVLLIPFVRIGEWLFAAQPASVSVAYALELIRADICGAIMTLWAATVHALVAWLALGSMAALAIYLVLAPALRKLNQSMQAEAR